MSDYVSKYNIVELDADAQKLASSFSCGNIYIDAFLKSPTALDIGFGKTYIWIDDDGREIVGFYNITTGSVVEASEEGYSKIGGSIHINEFAVSKDYQKVHVGDRMYVSDLLLGDCIERAIYIRENLVGFSFITLQSTKEGHYCYQRNDFEDIEDDMKIEKTSGVEDDCIPMYLPLDLV